MRKLALVLVVLGLLGLAQAGQAATLQSGWYANIRSVDIYEYDNQGWPHLAAGGYFYQTPAGDYGPFHVDGGTPSRNYQRYVSILADAYGVKSNASLDLPVSVGLPSSDTVAYLSVWWETNYDPSQMRLELLGRTSPAGPLELLWSQSSPGALSHSAHIGSGALVDGLTFRVVVVPEPGSLTSLLIPLSVCGAGLLGKRRAR